MLTFTRCLRWADTAHIIPLPRATPTHTIFFNYSTQVSSPRREILTCLETTNRQSQAWSRSFFLLRF